jgi:hypothetical protein
MVTNVTEKPDSREGLAAFAEKRKPSYKHWYEDINLWFNIFLKEFRSYYLFNLKNVSSYWYKI